ncbi:MAG: Ig-like domain-containing protein, partial [Chitinispirillaceae bacterium]
MTNRKNSTTLCVMLTASATLAILTVFAILSCTQPLDPGKTQPSISYPDSLHAIVAKPVEIMLERRSGGEPDSFSIFPELPSGIQINRQDGTISGTAEEVSAWRGYTIKADNSWGRGMDTIYFAVSPGAPTGITAVPYDGGRILVSWSRVFGADSYVVYRSGASDTTFEIVATPSDTLFWDTPGHDGEYRYAVSTRQGDAPLSAITAGNPVSFSINAAAPVLGEIPGQTIDEGGSFEPVDLVDYVTDIDTPDSLLQWNVQAQFLQTAVSEDHVLSISTPDSNWHGSDMVSIEVVDPDTLRSVVSVAFTVLSINDTPSISRPADIVLTDSTPAVEMNLFALIHDVETPDSLLTITIEAGDHLDVDRRDSILNIAARDVIWEGTDSLEITVEDPDGARVSEMIIVTIQKGNDAPRITAPDSYEIREGESFENVNLDAWVEDSDHSRDELSWETKRHNALIITISEDRHVTIDPPDEDWNGVDSSLFIVSDPLGATDSHLVKFIVHAVNDTPRILSTPLESAV